MAIAPGRLGPLFALVVASACTGVGPTTDIDQGAFQGKDSVLVDFEFDSEVRALEEDDARHQIKAQLFWLIGQMTEKGGNARMEFAEIKETGIDRREETRLESVISFHVKVPVAWPKKEKVPETTNLVFPRRLSSEDQKAFFAKYQEGCSSPGAHDQTASDFWHDFAPEQEDCVLDDDDVVRTDAKVSHHAANTEGTYAEYDRIWADEAFEGVFVFGLDEPGSEDEDDLGARDFRRFRESLQGDTTFWGASHELVEFDDDGRKQKQFTYDATFGEHFRIHLVGFLVSKLSYVGDAFVERYDAATAGADYIAYAGHAGLGGNIQRLVKIGTVVPNRYQLMVVDGCNTFAYLDRTLQERKHAANGTSEDPHGTRDLDLILNVLSTPWTYGEPAVLRVARDLMNPYAPKPFDKMLDHFPRSARAVIVGDEDNTYKP